MPKLTDDEVGQLLRETFADKEDLLDQLPEATTTPVRRKAPVLLAAAAVLVVLAGIAVATGLERGPNTQPVAQSPAPPMQTVPVGKVEPKHFVPGGAYIAGVAIAELTKWERPAAGWPVVKVLDASYSQASSPTEAGGKGIPLSESDQSSIVGSAGVPIEWVQSRPTGPDVCDQADGTPYVTLGPVVFNKARSSATIGMSMWRGCLDAQWLTYRLVPITTRASNVYESVTSWKVAGTVGPVAVS